MGLEFFKLGNSNRADNYSLILPNHDRKNIKKNKRNNTEPVTKFNTRHKYFYAKKIKCLFGVGMQA